ncbi:MAG: hypothetical protein LBH75_04895 [Treponema sp.]|jgi:hypothetical protein|nr:hypothetical protein [Treponema sp.]
MHTRTSGTIAGAAFGLSLLIGIIGGASLFWLLFRALVFAAGFFGLTEAIYFISDKFLVEPSSEKTDDPPQKGARVDISLDDEIQISRNAPPEDAAVEDSVENESTAAKTEHIEMKPDTDAAELTPIPPIQEIYKTMDSDITPMSDAFVTIDEPEEVFKAPRVMKQQVSEKVFERADPVKIVGAIRTLMKKD